MNLQEIEILIRKYESGETTIEEEMVLHNFFKNSKVPSHLVNYGHLFSFFNASKEESLDNEDFDDMIMQSIEEKDSLPNNKGKLNRLYSIISVAASIIILISVGLYFQSKTPRISFEDTYDNPELAFDETKRILMLVSGNMNTGSSELQNVAEFEEGFKELKKISSLKSGMKNMEKLSVLNKSKNLITSKK